MIKRKIIFRTASSTFELFEYPNNSHIKHTQIVLFKDMDFIPEEYEKNLMINKLTELKKEIDKYIETMESND